jgi:gamma-glutamyltranspeptidase/glutathione hydrolase
MVVAPHHLAAESGLAVLREDGNAVEAMLAAASTIAVVYPHMNSIGGDSFWLIHEPDGQVRAIDACGPAAGAASIDKFRERGIEALPFRGGDAALTVGGTVAGWDEAHRFSREHLDGRLPLDRLLADAIGYAEQGCAVTASQAQATADKAPELAHQPGFAEAFLPGGEAPAAGSVFRQSNLAATLRRLAKHGLDDFYRGELAEGLAQDLADAGSPLRLDDLHAYSARWVEPLAIELEGGTVYNTPFPTQGMASQMILGLMERLGARDQDPDSPEYVHAVVEATKLAFQVRNAVVTDPAHARKAPQDCLEPAFLDRLTASFDPDRALPWPLPADAGDTVWLGAIDAEGRAVSFIQSIYHEFGSGVVLPQSGVLWQNRGCSFALDSGALNPLAPGRKPFHTLNPPLARLRDGRTLVYGTMGGDGQPQTQAAVFGRHVLHGNDLAQAIEAPRWLLGRTWGTSTETLKLESRFRYELVERLIRLGHEVEVLEPYSETMGHAGALSIDGNGVITGASDPRSDGNAAAF